MSPRRLITARLAVHLLFLACLFAVFPAALWLRFSSGLFPIRDSPDPAAYGAFLLVAAAFWSLFARYFEIDELLADAPPFPRWAAACAKTALISAVAVSAAAFCYRGYSFSRVAIALFWSLHVAAVLAAGALVQYLRAALGARFRPLEVAVIGSDARARSLFAPGTQVRFIAPGDEPEIRNLRLSTRCDEVVVALGADEMPALPAVLRAAQSLPAPVRVLLDVPGASSVRRAGGAVLVTLDGNPADRLSYTVVKRLLDLVISSAALILGAPLALVIAVAIKLSSNGPVLFRQERIGAGGRRFTLYKFRTLPARPREVTDRHWSSTAPAEAGRLGQFLRQLGLDEWPQFWNVLRGEMSVVGPRPERPHFAEGFADALEAYALRQRLKPGITGLAQVQGLTGNSDISRRLQHDLAYLRNWSLGLDVKIILLTPLGALRRRSEAHLPLPSDAEPQPEHHA